MSAIMQDAVATPDSVNVSEPRHRYFTVQGINLRAVAGVHARYSQPRRHSFRWSSQARSTASRPKHSLVHRDPNRTRAFESTKSCMPASSRRKATEAKSDRRSARVKSKGPGHPCIYALGRSSGECGAPALAIGLVLIDFTAFRWITASSDHESFMHLSRCCMRSC